MKPTAWLNCPQGCGVRAKSEAKVQMKNLTDCEVVGSQLLPIVLFFNMLVCAYSGCVGWLLFWAIAFSSYAYDYGKTEARISSQNPSRTDL
jgi:hypothetical protein